MKHKLNNVKVLKQALGLFGVCAGAGLAFGVLTYRQINQQIDTGEANAELTQTLVETARINLLLHELNKGQSEEVKKLLASELAFNLTAIKTLSPAIDAQRREFAVIVAEHIARDEKKHPEYYLAANRPGGL